MSLELRIEGADRIARMLSVPLQPAIEAGALGIAAALQDILAPYPSQRSRPQPFVSDRQRRGFFAALRDGRIQVPYRRGGRGSETLGRKWSIQKVAFGARLRNPARYARLVHGSPGQTRYHEQGGWQNEDQARRKLQGEQGEIMESAIMQAVRRR